MTLTLGAFSPCYKKVRTSRDSEVSFKEDFKKLEKLSNLRVNFRFSKQYMSTQYRTNEILGAFGTYTFMHFFIP